MILNSISYVSIVSIVKNGNPRCFQDRKNAITFLVIYNFLRFKSKIMIDLAYTSTGNIENIKYMLSSHLTKPD